MLNSKKSKIKNILCSLILSFGFLLSAFSGISFASTKVYASTNNNIIEDVSSSVLSSYYNFYTTSTSKPATPNGWTELTDSSKNEDNIKRGIVDVENETTFNTDTYKTSKPTMPKSESNDTSYFKNLMINSYSGSGRFGYKSTSISLEENSFYSISVYLYTHRTQESEKWEETDPRASIYISGLLDEDDENYSSTMFENINTLESWTTYTFYIDTNESKSINLELWLGSKSSSVQGAVFFNNVKVVRYSEDYYVENISTKEDTNEDQLNIISLRTNYSSPVGNSSFEDISPIQWSKIAQSTSNEDNQVCEIVDVNNFKFTDDDTTITAPGSNCSDNNQNALFLYNKESGYQAVESTELNIKQQHYYKLTFWAKSDCNTGNGATVLLVDKSEENSIDSASLTLATTYTANSNIYRNDWTKYTFYIYGAANQDKSATIQIWLGTTDSKTSGYVFIDDFRIEDIDYSTYSNYSSATNSTTFNLNNATDNFSVSNSYFDRTENETETTTYPLAPAGWTKSGNTNNNTFSGVINTSETHFNENLADYHNEGNRAPTRPVQLPYMTENNNNVLMIGSSAETNSQTYASTDLSLSANSYYKVSFYVLTDYSKSNLQDNLGARVSITSGARTLFDYYNIYYTDNNWHKFEVYIKTGSNSETVNIALTFEGANGYVFFDDVILESSNETSYNSFYQYPDINYFKVDLTKENFDNRTYNKFEDLQTPNNWVGTEASDLNVKRTGIINTSNSLINDIADTLSGNDNVLYINSLQDVNYTYNSRETYTFSAQTYYKITVNVLTRNISQENEIDEDVTYGASIGLKASKEIFLTGINTNNEWKTYTLYLCLDEDLTSAISLSLGYTNQPTSGEVLFDNLVIETIDKDTYTTELESADTDLIKSFIDYTETEDEETQEDDSWTSEFNWLIIPSIITGLAIIIAVVGFYIRRINFSRKPKIKTRYDRRRTLDRDIDKREKIALRQQIIEELNAELVSIDKEMEEYKILAEKQLQELRDKIIQEQEEIKRKKLDIEIRKKEATAERAKQLKENPELVSNIKAEKEYESFIAKLDKQELNLQKQLTAKDVKLASTTEIDKSQLAKFLERKEFIKNEIAKIEAEIEEIAKEEEDMWEEYKLAKADAKKRKAEYKEQVKETKAKSKSKDSSTKKSSK